MTNRFNIDTSSSLFSLNYAGLSYTDLKSKGISFIDGQTNVNKLLIDSGVELMNINDGLLIKATNINVGNATISNMASPILPNDCVNKLFLQEEITDLKTYVNLQKTNTTSYVDTLIDSTKNYVDSKPTGIIKLDAVLDCNGFSIINLPVASSIVDNSAATVEETRFYYGKSTEWTTLVDTRMQTHVDTEFSAQLALINNLQTQITNHETAANLAFVNVNTLNNQQQTSIDSLQTLQKQIDDITDSISKLHDKTDETDDKHTILDTKVDTLSLSTDSALAFLRDRIANVIGDIGSFSSTIFNW
jgi:hypothetical protein